MRADYLDVLRQMWTRVKWHVDCAMLTDDTALTAALPDVDEQLESIQHFIDLMRRECGEHGTPHQAERNPAVELP